jgi:hypothetical protein
MPPSDDHLQLAIHPWFFSRGKGSKQRQAQRYASGRHARCPQQFTTCYSLHSISLQSDGKSGKRVRKKKQKNHRVIVRV